MITLNSLTNSCRAHKKIKRVGRGPGSGVGKTCGRGEKGAGSRSGYKRRWGYEGGQMRLFMKLPVRGFNNMRFAKKFCAVNLIQINALFNDGETVNYDTLREKGLLGRRSHGVKVIGEGEITKKLKLEVNALSSSARDKLHKAKIAVTEKK